MGFATVISKEEVQEELWLLPCSLPSFKQLPTPHEEHQRHQALTAARRRVLRGQVSQSGGKSEGVPLVGEVPQIKHRAVNALTVGQGKAMLLSSWPIWRCVGPQEVSC